MRSGLWALAALVLGAFAAHFLLQDRGYVLINFRGYQVEMSVPGMVLAFTALYLALRVLAGLWRAPRAFGEHLAERRSRRSARKLTEGLMHIAEGRWAKGERLLTGGLRGADAPLVNYLMAARAAQLQGSTERRDEWLKLAYEKLPQAETTVLLTQAELQIADGELERALATLQRIQERHPSHPVALALLAETYDALGDWQHVVELLPRLSDARLAPQALETLAAAALERWLERSELTHDELTRLWSALPPPLRRSAPLMRLRALALERLGRADEAEKELRGALKRRWDEELVIAYGQIRGSDPNAQLRRAEGWLTHHPEDPALLLSAARLCVANELWGKARSYLESSLALAPRPESYSLYAQLLNQLGEPEGAALAYRSGLGLVTGGGAVPALGRDAPDAVGEHKG